MLTVDDLDPLDPALALAVASENGTDLTAVRARGGHRGQPKRGRRTGRRRWPIVTSLLAVLLAIVVAGGYVAWRLSQNQYYVGADGSGHVVIYRGVNERIAGISLSHPYQTPTPAIDLRQVPSPYKQTLQSTDPANNLPAAQEIVKNVRSAVSTCRQDYVTLQNWVNQENAYQHALTVFNKSNSNNKKPAKDKPTPPPPAPTPAPSSCPAPTYYGIPSSALQPAAAGSS
jgi:protein phosphatase